MVVPLAAARPLDAGDILDATVRSIRRHFGLFATISLLPFVAWIPVDLAGRALLDPDARLSVDLVATWLLPSTLGWSACTWAAWRLSLGQPATVGAAFAACWRRLPALLLVSLMSGLLGLVLCLTIVGIRLVVGWSFATAALFAEGLGPGDALARGRALARGTWWRACGILVALLVCSVIASFVPTLPEMLVHGELLPEPVEIVGGFDPALLALDVVVTALGGAFGTPIGAIGTFLLYRDLRIRKEGWDILARAEQLDERAA